MSESIKAPMLALVALVALLSAGARADDARTEKTDAIKPGSAKSDEKKPEPDRYLAIRGGIVHTVTGPTLEGATVLAKNDHILAIGRAVEIPKGATVLDAAGHHVYPGLIALSSSGILGYSAPDAADVYGLGMTLGLAGGLTTVVMRNDVAKLSFGVPDDLVLARGLFESISYSSRSPSARRRLREAFESARQYLRDKRAYDEAKQRGEADAKAPSEPRGTAGQALRLIRGEAAARVSANEVHDIRSIVELARHYGFRVVLDGAGEAWTMAREIGGARAAAVLTPRTRRDPNPRLNRPSGASIESARILWEHGVPFGLVPPRTSISTGGLAGRDLLHLPMEAAYAVRGGLPEKAAIESITIQPARMLGLDHRIGSIEVGKDADVIVTDGPLLHYMTHVRWTVVNGRVSYDKAKDSLFDHIRPEKSGGKPARDHWPRRLGEDW